MWTERRRSWFMLVRVKTAGKTGFVFPFSLPVLEEAVAVLADLALVGDLLFPGWLHRFSQGGEEEQRRKPCFFLSQAVRLIGAVFPELRRYGRWQMVEVETGGQKISVEFY